MESAGQLGTFQGKSGEILAYRDGYINVRKGGMIPEELDYDADIVLGVIWYSDPDFLIVSSDTLCTYHWIKNK